MAFSIVRRLAVDDFEKARLVYDLTAIDSRFSPQVQMGLGMILGLTELFILPYCQTCNNL